MKTRNPVAGNAFKFNKPSVIPNKVVEFSKKEARRPVRVWDMLEDA